MSENIDKAIGFIQSFLEVVEVKIEAALAAGIPLATTKVAKEIAGDFGMEWPQAYHIINAYLMTRPELEVAKGPKGGVVYKRVKPDVGE